MKKLKYVIPACLGLVIPFYMERIWKNMSWMSDDFGRGTISFCLLVAVAVLTGIMIADGEF